MADVATGFTAIPTRSKSVLRRRSSVWHWLQCMTDMAASILPLYLHIWLKDGHIPDEYFALAGVTAIVLAITYNARNVYEYRPDHFRNIANKLKSWLLTLGLILLAGFAMKVTEVFSREVLLTWVFSGFAMQVMVYVMFLRLIHARKRARATTSKAALIVGSNRLARHLIQHIQSDPYIDEHVAGIVDDDVAALADWDDALAPTLGGTRNIEAVLDTYNVRKVYISVPMDRSGLVEDLYRSLASRNIDITWAPDIFEVNLLNHQVHEMAGVPVISLSESPLSGTSALLKNVMDRSLAALGLLVLSPLMLLTALLIKLDSPGPVFFRQRRHGWDGRIINVWKFRSMVVHEEKSGTTTQATKNDARVTRVGAFIRRTSIDELPQLFNVLGGSMSLVGPRPHAVAHNEYYSGKIQDYLLRHRIKPGLTGLAQVNGFRGETKELEAMEGRVRYDLAYINSWSIWLDMQIIVRTFFTLLSKNAY